MMQLTNVSAASAWSEWTVSSGNGGGGALNFVSGRGVRPGFPKCGACELMFASEKGACELKTSKFGDLWAEIFQIWGLVS